MKHSLIICGPQGCGKTRNKEALRKFFGLKHVIDGWHPSQPAPKLDVLMLTLDDFHGLEKKGVRVMTFFEAMKHLRGGHALHYPVSAHRDD